MSFLVLLAVFLLGSFAFVVVRGAPYVPTLKGDIQRALDVAQLRPGQTLVDLGSGDGRLLAAAAERGIRAVGYELNPILVLISRWRCRKYGDLVTVRLVDFWHSKLPEEAQAVFVFLAEPFMDRLSRHLHNEAKRLNHSLLLVSYGFEIQDLEPIQRQKALICYRIEP